MRTANPDLRARMIASARQQLLQADVHDISIRKTADECGVAVGSIYTYFPSKDALLVAVMMDDWLACLKAMREGAETGAEALDALRAITKALCGFTKQYAPVWAHYSSRKNSMREMNTRHSQVIEILSEAVLTVLKRFHTDYEGCLPEVLAELILMASRKDDGFDYIAPVLAKMLH